MASSTSVQALVAENAALKADLDAVNEWQVVSDDEVPGVKEPHRGPSRRPAAPSSSSTARSARRSESLCSYTRGRPRLF